jgi:hypothetical protein
MNSFTNFLTKAAEFYLSAPSFFNWAAPIAFALLCVVIYGAYWLGTRLEGSSREALKAKAEALEERLKLARDRSDEAMQKAEDLKRELTDLKNAAEAGSSLVVTRETAAHLDLKATNLLQANTAVSFSLTPASLRVTRSSE